MKVLRDGKEIKGASVSYYEGGIANTVTVDGVNYDASAFELVDEETKKTTKPAETKKRNASVMTTENTAVKKK